MSVPVLSSAFSRGFALALVWHATDVRKDTEIPYVSHLMAVASLVLEDGGDEDQAVAALLHDAGEDAGGEMAVRLIEKEFNPRVAAIVRACSDSLLPRGEEKEPWGIRKQRYLEHLVELAEAGDTDALLVTACDKLHNARSILVDYRREGDRLWERFNATSLGVLWYHGIVLDIVREPLAGRRVVAQLEEVVEALFAEVGLERPTTSGTTPPPGSDKAQHLAEV